MKDQNVLTMQAAKDLVRENIQNLEATKGVRFMTPKGVLAILTGAVSERGKPTAEIACSEVLEDGTPCQETHIREISDWHQSDKCRTHKKSRTRSGSVSIGSSSGDTLSLKKMKVLETDDDETRRLKEEQNAVIDRLNEANKAESDRARALKAEERKAKDSEEKERKAIERKKKAAEQLREKLALTLKVAQEKGIAVSSATLAAAQDHA